MTAMQIYILRFESANGLVTEYSVHLDYASAASAGAALARREWAAHTAEPFPQPADLEGLTPDEWAMDMLRDTFDVSLEVEHADIADEVVRVLAGRLV
jgi:hypothetical protein